MYFFKQCYYKALIAHVERSSERVQRIENRFKEKIPSVFETPEGRRPAGKKPGDSKEAFCDPGISKRKDYFVLRFFWRRSRDF